MAGGTRIVAFDSGTQDAPGDEILLTDEVTDVTLEPEDGFDETPARARRLWVLPVLGGLALVAWTAFFGWAMGDRLSAGTSPEQSIGLLRDWAVPVLLGAIVALMALRNSRRLERRGFLYSYDMLGEAATTAEDAEHEVLGFLTLDPGPDDDPELPFRFTGQDTDYPEEWQEEARDGSVRLKAHYRRHRAQAVRVRPDGSTGADGLPAWFAPGKFRYCLRCGETWGTQGKDITRLASLSAEGRSSATTVPVASLR